MKVVRPVSGLLTAVRRPNKSPQTIYDDGQRQRARGRPNAWEGRLGWSFVLLQTFASGTRRSGCRFPSLPTMHTSDKPDSHRDR